MMLAMNDVQFYDAFTRSFGVDTERKKFFEM